MDIETKYFRVSIPSLLAEFTGTATLLFLGCLGCLFHQAGLSFGMALITAIQIFGHISGGHFNPAVTVASVVFEMFSIPVAAFYIVSQMLGATAGFTLAMYLAPDEYHTRGSGSTFCNTIPTVDDHICFLYEFISTFLLVLLCCSVWDTRNEGKRDSVAIKLGLFLVAAVQLVGPMTGASLNPARTFGPSVVNNNWSHHWVYWIAPLLAGILGSLLYKYVFLEKRSTRR